MIKENIYEKFQPLDKALFECDFEFVDLSKKEKDLLKEAILKVNGTMMEFNLFYSNKKIEPLETLIKLKSNKLTGDVKINMHDKKGMVIGVVIFKTLKITEIKNLIDFDFSEPDINKAEKTIVIEFIYDDILYTSDGKEFEKIT
jgi:hypothetical protein